MKSLKFEQFPTTSTSSNAENDRTVGKSYDILSRSTWLSAQETPSTSEDLFISLLPSLHLTSTLIAKTGNFHSQSGTEPCNPAVKISIQYTSKPLNKRLPSDYESISKALMFGPPERIAKAVIAKIYRGSKFAALIEKCAVIGLIKQSIHFSRRSWGRKIASQAQRGCA